MATALTAESSMAIASRRRLTPERASLELVSSVEEHRTEGGGGESGPAGGRETLPLSLVFKIDEGPGPGRGGGHKLFPALVGHPDTLHCPPGLLHLLLDGGELVRMA